MVDYTTLDDGVLKDSNVDQVTNVERIEKRDWSKDNIGQRVSEVQNNVDTVETILQDINQQIQNIPSYEELEDEWEGFLDRMPTDNRGEAKQLPRAFYEAERDRNELLLRQAIWQARLKELERLARRKLSEKYDLVYDELIALKSESSLEDILEVESKFSEMKELKHQMEKMGQSLREQQRSMYRMMEKVAEKEGTGFSRDELEEAQLEILEKFTKSNGSFVLDESELEQDRKQVERESAAESAAESVVESDSDEGLQVKTDDGIYILRNRNFDDKVDVVCTLWDEENIQERVEDPDDGITKSEIADMTDLSQSALFNNGFFERIEDEKEIFLKRP